MSKPSKSAAGRQRRHTPKAEILHQRFLAILPTIERHGQVYFHHLKSWHRLQEALAEMTAIAWRWFLRLVAKGKDAADFPTILASYAARAVRSGRRLCGQERAKDAMSTIAQKRRRCCCNQLPCLCFRRSKVSKTPSTLLRRFPRGGAARSATGQATSARSSDRPCAGS
jgi:hypothetical protein